MSVSGTFQKSTVRHIPIKKISSSRQMKGFHPLTGAAQKSIEELKGDVVTSPDRLLEY